MSADFGTATIGQYPKKYTFSIYGGTHQGLSKNGEFSYYESVIRIFEKFESTLEAAGHNKNGDIYPLHEHLSPEFYHLLRSSISLGPVVLEGPVGLEEVENYAKRFKREKMKHGLSKIDFRALRQFGSLPLQVEYIAELGSYGLRKPGLRSLLRKLINREDPEQDLGGTFEVRGVVHAVNEEAMEKFKELVKSVFCIEGPKYQELK